MNVTLFRNRVFTDVIKLTIFGEDYFGFRVSPKSNDWCPHRRDLETQDRFMRKMTTE